MGVSIYKDDDTMIPLQEWLNETEQMIIPDEYLICENLINKYSKEIIQLKIDVKKIADEKGVWVGDEMEVEIEGDYEDPYSFNIRMKVLNGGWKEWSKIENQVWDLVWKLPKELSKKFSIRGW